MIKFTYITDRDELLKELGVTEEKAWEYISLDDWDYALVFDDHIPPKKMEDDVGGLLQGGCSNEWVYFSDENKTVGMAYHA